MGEKFHNHHLRNRQSLSFRGDNWPNCGSDNGGRKFVGSYRTFAGAFLLDILLCSQVTSSELRKIESISNYFISQFSDLFGYWICRTKRVGWVLKLLVLLFLPLPLVLWPVVAIVGSLLGGIGFGFFSPLIATFEVIGTDHKDKCFHCFVVSSTIIKHQKIPINESSTISLLISCFRMDVFLHSKEVALWFEILQIFASILTSHSWTISVKKFLSARNQSTSGS